jgi:hypothetical protein
MDRRDAKTAEKTPREKILLKMRRSRRLHCEEHGEEQEEPSEFIAACEQLGLLQYSGGRTPLRRFLAYGALGAAAKSRVLK